MRDGGWIRLRLSMASLQTLLVMLLYMLLLLSSCQITLSAPSCRLEKTLDCVSVSSMPLSLLPTTPGGLLQLGDWSHIALLLNDAVVSVVSCSSCPPAGTPT